VRIELADPVTHRIKGFFRCAVVSEDHTVGLVEVLHCHCAETFLPGRVPHQQLNVLTIDLHILDLEVDTYGCDVLGGKLLIGELLQKTTLTDLSIA
jgi:hypothetical protein